MMTDVKEVNRKLKEALKNFRDAVELVRKNMIVGSYIVGGPEKKVRKKRTPKVTILESSTPESIKKPRKKRDDRRPIQRVPDSQLPNMD